LIFFNPNRYDIIRKDDDLIHCKEKRAMVRSIRAAQEKQEAPTLSIPDNLWQVTDVMRFLKVGKNKVYHLIREKKLPYIRLGNDYRFHPGAIARWAEQQQEVI
jgi:excisionase family DNA binding protein